MSEAISKPLAAKSFAFDYFLLIMLAALFGSSFIMTKVAVAEVPPATLVLARLLIAGIIIAVVMGIIGQNLRTVLSYWKMICVAGLFGNAAPFFLISWGQAKVDAGLTAILMAIMPLITIVLAHVFIGDEKLTIFKVIGFCMGLVGVAVLIGFDKLLTLGEETTRQYAIMAAACCYAVNAIVSRFLVDLPRYALSSALLLVSALMLLPISLYLDQPWTLSISGTSWAMVFLLGVFPTALGTLMLFAIIARQGAGFLSQINFLVPVFGVLWAIALLNESLPPNALAALVIILAGVAIARIKFNRQPINKPINKPMEKMS